MKPNEPCWCGSGLKWKKCHRLREDEALVRHVGQPLSRLLKAFKSGRVCYHPDAPRDCHGPVISSHTVQRAGHLKAIARDGHVLSFRTASANEHEKLPRLMGLRDASTFPGFCAKHDNSLFELIERRLSKVEVHHALLMLYRNVAYELHQKRVSVGGAAIISALDAGRPLHHQRFVQQLSAEFSHGATIAVEELEEELSKAAFAIKEGLYHNIHSITFVFDGIIPFSASFYVAPYVNTANQEIQGWYDRDIEYLSFYSSILGGRSAITLSWIDSDLVSKLARDMAAAGPGEIASLMFTFALGNSENVFVDPRWYESLGQRDRDEIDEVFSFQLPGEVPKPLFTPRRMNLITAQCEHIAVSAAPASPV
ncbi:MAG: SEC-C domain-containing protein [Brevundimonas sp.]|nr:SEC-C domain-containing protein [Brevundimonas sp.]